MGLGPSLKLKTFGSKTELRICVYYLILQSPGLKARLDEAEDLSMNTESPEPKEEEMCVWRYT